jgi:predicted NBD/HSP70 family sugar kinase
VDVNVDRAHLIGIKLSNGSMNMVRTNMRGAILAETTTPLASNNVDDVVDTVVEAVATECAGDEVVAAVGVSLAGPVSPRSPMVELSPFLGWRGVPLVQLIEARTGLLAVVENDVRALTAVEHWFGAAAGMTDFALITVGLGVGCGLVLNDQMIEGTGGGVGQIGHLHVTDNGPLCEHGHRGCARSYLASTLMIGQAGALLGKPDLSWADLLNHARAGNRIAVRVLSDAARALGTVIGAVAALTAPAKVLISGEGVDMVPLVFDEIRSAAAEIQHWTVAEVPIEVAQFTFTEWARGAAVVALKHTLELSVSRDDE